MHNFETIAYRARSARDVARILDTHRVTTGPRRVAALKSFMQNDFAIVAVPAGRVVINRKG